jgi:hypothetical protein
MGPQIGVTSPHPLMLRVLEILERKEVLAKEKVTEENFSIIV